MRARALFVTAFAAAHLTGCSAPKVEPEIASAASQATYAEHYPAELNGLAAGFSERQVQTRKLLEKFKEYPTKLKDPDWAVVLDVFTKADEVGKSYAYVERMRGIDGAHAFFETEHDEITRKVAGAAQYVVDQKHCEGADVGGAVNQGLKVTVDKQLEKELRSASEAHQIIARYKAELKDANVAELEKDADNIEFASYVVHIELVEDKVRLQRMLQEADAVRKSQDDFIETEKAFQARKATTDPEKKDSQARIEAMQKSKTQLDTALVQAKDLQPKMEKEVTDAQKGYDDALADLKDRVKQKIQPAK